MILTVNIITIKFVSERRQEERENRMAQEKNKKKISLQTVERLSLYRRIFEELHNEGVVQVYSHQLAKMVSVTPAQLRRDLIQCGLLSGGE